MGSSPNPPNQTFLIRAVTILAPIVAIVSIGLFLALYFGLENAGVAPFPRLILALCAPPALLAAGLGITIILFSGRRNKAKSINEKQYTEASQQDH